MTPRRNALGLLSVPYYLVAVFFTLPSWPVSRPPSFPQGLGGRRGGFLCDLPSSPLLPPAACRRQHDGDVEVRFLIGAARPMARARQRFSAGPWSAVAVLMINSDSSSLKLLTALAAAEFNTFRTGSAAAFGKNANCVRAASILRPAEHACDQAHRCAATFSHILRWRGHP